MGSSLWVAGGQGPTRRPGVSGALCRTLGGAMSPSLGSGWSVKGSLEPHVSESIHCGGTRWGQVG